MVRNPVALVVFALVALPAAARAGAWTQPRGGVYAKLEAAWLTTDRVFDADGDEVDYISALSPGEYRERQLRAYVEYGVVPRLTLVAGTALQRLEVRERSAVWRTWGLSDIRIGARWGLPTRGVVSAVAADVKIPTGYDADDFPSLGSGDPDVTLSVQAGRSFGPAYATADVGYALRAGALADEIPWSLELGWRASRRLGLRAALRGRQTTAGSLAGGGLDPVRNDSESLKLGAAADLALSHAVAIEAAAARALAGKQTLAGTELSLGVVWRR